MAESNLLEITALGRIAALGAVYDARTEEFTGQSVLQEDIPDDDLTITAINNSNMEIAVTDSYSEKFEKLHISGGLKVSVLLGLVNLEGSGNYLKQTKSSTRSVSGALIYTENTVEKQINTNHKNLAKYLITERGALDPHSGTHFVKGIRWGRSLVVMIEQNNIDSSQLQEANGKLEATLTNATTWSVNAQGAGGNVDNSSNRSHNYSIKICGDLLQDGEPVSLENAVKKLRKRSELIKGGRYDNTEIGNAILYILAPLNRLPNAVTLGINTALSTIQRVDETSVKAIIVLFDDISSKRQFLSDYFSEVERHEYCLTQKQRNAVKDILQEFEEGASNFSQRLRPTLKAVRAGEQDTMELNKICAAYKSGSHSSYHIKTVLSNIKGAMDVKMAWAQKLVTIGGKFIPPFETVAAAILRTNSASTILYIKEEWLTNSNFKELWENIFDIYAKVCSEDNGFQLVDCDVHPSSDKDVPCIEHFNKNGRLVLICLGLQNEQALLECIQANNAGTGQETRTSSTKSRDADGEANSIPEIDNCHDMQYEGKQDHVFILHISPKASVDEREEATASFVTLKESRAMADAGKDNSGFFRCKEIHKGGEEPVQVHWRQRGELKSRNVIKDLDEIPMLGTYHLTDNGNYDAFLKGIGLTGFPNWIIRSWISWTPTSSTVEISNGCYTIGEGSGGVWYRNEFKLDEQVSKTTPDGVSMKSHVTKALNCLREVQKLTQDGKIRIITRVFMRDQMLIHFHQDGVPSATRVFKRVK